MDKRMIILLFAAVILLGNSGFNKDGLNFVLVLVLVLCSLFMLRDAGFFLPSSKKESMDKQNTCTTEDPKPPRTSSRIIVGKISYVQEDILGIGTSTVYHGLFEEKVPVAVKEISNVDVKYSDDISNAFLDIQLKLKPRQTREREINQTHTDWDCPHLVRYYGFEIAEHQKKRSTVCMYLALEKCQLNLKTFITARERYPPVFNYDIFCQMANGLDYLHRNNIVHRDLKPANVLIKLDSKDKITFKIADFGMAKFLPDNSSDVSLSLPCGTKDWMAPEILDVHSENSSNPARFHIGSDIYSLGMIFFYVASNGEKRRVITEDDNDLIDNDDTLVSLVTEMMHTIPGNRLKTDGVLKHPALWSPEKVLEFFTAVSNILYAERNKECLEEPGIINNDWREPLPVSVQTYFFPTNREQKSGAKYKKNKVQSLLRAIRNSSSHPNEHPSELGTSGSERFAFWTKNFPKLLMHTYKSCKERPQLSKFY